MNATTIHVATLAVEDLCPAHWPALDAILDREEHERAARYHFAADRQAFIAAHGLLRLLLSALGGIAPAAWRFAAGPFGKPTLAGPGLEPPLHFNLTHTRRLVAAAVYQGAGEAAIGIDVEAVDRRTVDIGIARAFFAAAETEQLLAIADPARRQERFIALWTLKEALVKATGLGLSQPLADFAFRFDPIRVCFRDAAPGAGHWHFRQWRPHADHFMALAVRWPAAEPPDIRRWSFSDNAILRAGAAAGPRLESDGGALPPAIVDIRHPAGG